MWYYDDKFKCKVEKFLKMLFIQRKLGVLGLVCFQYVKVGELSL